MRKTGIPAARRSAGERRQSRRHMRFENSNRLMLFIECLCRFRQPIGEDAPRCRNCLKSKRCGGVWSRRMVGARLVHVDQRRPICAFPFPTRFAERLTGRRIDALGRRAKYLLADLDDGTVLVMHLGMSGSFRIEGGDGAKVASPCGARAKNAAHDHVVFALSNGARVIYNDPRRFGFMHARRARRASAASPLHALGIEPLGDELDGAALARLFAGKTTPLKAALLDQSLIAGLGNIYVCEALHRAGLSPRRAAGTPRAERRRADARARIGWRRRSARCSKRPSRPAGRRCAITARPTARSAISSTLSASTTAN